MCDMNELMDSMYVFLTVKESHQGKQYLKKNEKKTKEKKACHSLILKKLNK